MKNAVSWCGFMITGHRKTNIVDEGLNEACLGHGNRFGGRVLLNVDA